MTLNGIPVFNYSIGETEASLVLSVSSIQDAINLVSADMMLKDGAGNDFLAIRGYDEVKKVSYMPAVGGYEIILSRSNGIQSLRDENARLNAKLNAAIQSNQMLEECLVEMAEIVYA